MRRLVCRYTTAQEEGSVEELTAAATGRYTDLNASYRGAFAWSDQRPCL